MGKGEADDGTDDLARLDAVGLADAIRKGEVPPPPAANASNAANAAEGNAASPAPDNGSDAADAP